MHYQEGCDDTYMKVIPLQEVGGLYMIEEEQVISVKDISSVVQTPGPGSIFKWEGSNLRPLSQNVQPFVFFISIIQWFFFLGLQFFYCSPSLERNCCRKAGCHVTIDIVYG